MELDLLKEVKLFIGTQQIKIKESKDLQIEDDFDSVFKGDENSITVKSV